MSKWLSKIRDKDPERYKILKAEANRKYLERKFQKELESNKVEMLNKVEGSLRLHLNKLTRILFNHVPKICEVCGGTEYIQIHHKRYTYPIEKKDLMWLCEKHHIEEHQKINPTK